MLCGEEICVEKEVADMNCYGLTAIPIHHPPVLLREEAEESSVKD